jgi:hypothetical protein
MLSELETRLYRCRETRSGALDEFDEVCAQHHAEMGVLREALLDKFGVEPMIDVPAGVDPMSEDGTVGGCAGVGSTRHRRLRRAGGSGRWCRGSRKARRARKHDARAGFAAEARTSRAVTPTAPRPPEMETLVCISCGASSSESERAVGSQRPAHHAAQLPSLWPRGSRPGSRPPRRPQRIRIPLEPPFFSTTIPDGIRSARVGTWVITPTTRSPSRRRSRASTTTSSVSASRAPNPSSM